MNVVATENDKTMCMGTAYIKLVSHHIEDIVNFFNKIDTFFLSCGGGALNEFFDFLNSNFDVPHILYLVLFHGYPCVLILRSCLSTKPLIHIGFVTLVDSAQGS
jgi:hypothetical protein